jgi:GT2 family glycosyltransferase
MMPDTVREDPELPIGWLRPDGSFVGNFHLGRRQDVDFGKGCNMSFRRDLLLRVGGCDERYRGGFYREDGDLFARVKALGCRVVFEPDAHLVHLEAGGGSRTEADHSSPQREQTVFHNETLFYLSCMRPRRLAQHYLRMLRWAWAIKRSRGYSWPGVGQTVWGIATGTYAYFGQRPLRLSLRHGYRVPQRPSQKALESDQFELA